MKINSPIFGETEVMDEDWDAYERLEKLIDEHPVNAFEILNKKLNKLNFCIMIDTDLKIR